MPDWSYRTVFQLVLFRLPAATARDLTLKAMGTLARLPFGSSVISFMGHMQPPAMLGRELLGRRLISPIGLGAGVDVNAEALPALTKFGFGMLEIGPVSSAATPAPVDRQDDAQTIWFPHGLPALGVEDAQKRLREVAPRGLPIIVRLQMAPGQTPEGLAKLAQDLLHAGAGFLASDLQGLQALGAAGLACPRLLCLTVDQPAETMTSQVEQALAMGTSGVLLVGSVEAAPQGCRFGTPVRHVARERVRHLRARFGPDVPILAGGGVHEPADALALLDAGADVVMIDSGLVFGGPGLPKRINEAIVHRLSAAGDRLSADSRQPRAESRKQSWFWTLLLGLGMLLGGLMASIFAATGTILPYDETFVGMTRDQLHAVNDRLLAFMAHDRVSLAGTMVSIGILYTGLSWYGVRRGVHWAWIAILASAFAGFASFFFFLGFGYFDPFHAFVTAILFQFLLLAFVTDLPPLTDPTPPMLREDRAFRLGLWGQLVFVFHGAALLGAGLDISRIGLTHVFVPEDLEFMRTTREALLAANPRLIPLVAHDRASFGGMLVSNGVVVLLTSLWGFRRGYRWLWWTFLLAGTPAYISAIGVHLAVGYTSLMHLMPAFSGLAIYVTGLVLSWPYLCARTSEPDA